MCYNFLGKCVAMSPGIVNRTFGNRTQSNSNELNPWIEFDWFRQSNEIEHELCLSSISKPIEFNWTNRTQSNSIHWIVFDWVRPKGKGINKWRLGASLCQTKYASVRENRPSFLRKLEVRLACLETMQKQQHHLLLINPIKKKREKGNDTRSNNLPGA